MTEIDLIELVGKPFFLRALIGVVIISINASIAGSFTIFRNVSFLVAGASHSALAGTALFILLQTYLAFNVNPLAGGVLFAILTAIFSGYAGKRDTNTAIGISFAMSMSLAVLFISMIREYSSRVWTFLIGDLFLLTHDDIYIMLGVTAINIFLVALFYRHFIFISFDYETATAFGLNSNLYNYILLSMIAISTVALLKGVGALLVFSMLIAPSAVGNIMARDLRSVFVISFMVALLCGIGGIAVSLFYPVSPGAISSLIASTLYFSAVSFRKIAKSQI